MDIVKAVDRLEKSLAHNELVLARKLADVSRYEQKLEKFVHKEHLDEMRKELKKLAKHEDLIFDTNKYIHEVISELSKVKISQEKLKDRLRAQEDKLKAESDERMAVLKSEVKKMRDSVPKHREEIAALRDRMYQLEYQNKLLLKYVRTLEENMQK